MRFSDILSTRFLRTTRAGIERPWIPTNLEDDVQFMATLFEGIECPVYLIGGIGMALRVGHFYREHKDFDLAIFTDELPIVMRHLEKRNYLITTRRFMTHISPKYNIQAVTTYDPKRANIPNPEKLHTRGLKKSGPLVRVHFKRTDYFDIFFLGKSDGGVIAHGFKVVIPWNDFLPAEKISEKSNLLLPNLNYKRYLPPRKGKQQQDFDMNGLKPVDFIEG